MHLIVNFSDFVQFTSNHTLAQRASCRVVKAPGLLYSNSWAQLLDPEVELSFKIYNHFIDDTSIGHRGDDLRHLTILVSQGAAVIHALGVVPVHLGLRRKSHQYI